ncbi:hypothetical protein L1887_07921 [Cichorium endivia]|nr:hypothetical protein L1887_07921 [Cichorium endivia]
MYTWGIPERLGTWQLTNDTCLIDTKVVDTIGGSGLDLRSKARTLSTPLDDPQKLPKWNYDGSSTGQAHGKATPKFGLEQEYTLLQKDTKWPLGWPLGGYPRPQGPYYCGVGAEKAFGRDIADAHYKACLYAGITISGINAEVMPGQWEFQVGPSAGIIAADELWVARYILERVAEITGVIVSFNPKPIPGDWNGAGAHTNYNYSTKSMRKDGGYEVIQKAIEKLRLSHEEHIASYGEGNEHRLTGHHETADINTFSWGVAKPGVSIHVGRETAKEGKGYFEDRRPGSNMDPYVVTSMIAETTILWKP